MNTLKEEISEIKNLFEEENPLGEDSNKFLRDFRKQRIDANNNPFTAGILYYRCLNVLVSIDFSSYPKLNEEINKYQNKKSDKDLDEKERIEWERFEKDLIICETNSYSGRSFAPERIKDFVTRNKKEILSLISLFFNIFSEEN